MTALVEALMGFQFNSVGGGTKTRRPIAIHMKYNASCTQPACFLLSDDGTKERSMVLRELQVIGVCVCSDSEFLLFRAI